MTFFILIGYEALSLTVAKVSERQIVSDDKFHEMPPRRAIAMLFRNSLEQGFSNFFFEKQYIYAKIDLSLCRDIIPSAFSFCAVIINERPLTYSRQLISQLPIKYLVRHAQTKQTEYGALYPTLLRCVSTHYPHLCLVEEWLADEVEETTRQKSRKRKQAHKSREGDRCTPDELKEGNLIFFFFFFFLGGGRGLRLFMDRSSPDLK